MSDLSQPFFRLSDFNSLKIKFWAFISMVLLVFVHGYNLKNNYLQPWSQPQDPASFTSFFEYLLANGILRFRIPMLFIISGYLFSLNDYKPYKVRILKRINTLLLPYLLWSAIWMIITFLLEFNSFTREVVYNSRLLRISDMKMLLHDYNLKDIVFKFLFKPIPYQLWFIRVLIIYNIAYPIIRFLILNNKTRWVFFGIALLLWIFSIRLYFIEGEGILFFSIGIWMNKSNFDISAPPKWLNISWFGFAFLFLSIIKTWLAFNGREILKPEYLYITLITLHKLIIFSGLCFAWFGSNELVSKLMARRWFVFISSFSFIIYAFHAPLIIYATKALFPLMNHIYGYRLLIFTILPILIIAFSIGAGITLRKYLPRFYSLLTGGRGF